MNKDKYISWNEFLKTKHYTIKRTNHMPKIVNKLKSKGIGGNCLLLETRFNKYVISHGGVHSISLHKIHK